MGQAQKIKLLGLFTPFLRFQFSQRAKFQNLGLIRCNFKPKFSKPSVQLFAKPIRIGEMIPPYAKKVIMQTNM
jgi:hypothetical protein